MVNEVLQETYFCISGVEWQTASRHTTGNSTTLTISIYFFNLAAIDTLRTEFPADPLSLWTGKASTPNLPTES